MTVAELEMASQVKRFEKQAKANQMRKIREKLVKTFLEDDPNRKEPSLEEIRRVVDWLSEESENLDKI
ncbi:MAG: hypothetical protein LBN43_05670 [Oscillospiraceae bacterium]|jgi:hypothetical protein|nr:hypothetical protein [Oscillospiraceae bacterium]